MAALAPVSAAGSSSAQSAEPSRYRVLVIGMQHADGKGDVAIAGQIARMVRQQGKGRVEVVFTYTQPVPSALEHAFTEKFPRVILTQEEERDWGVTPFKTLNIQAFDSVAVFPTFGDSHLPSPILKDSKRLVKLREYGAGPHEPAFTKGPTYTLGLGKGEYGAILYPDLYQYFLEHQDDTPTQRLQNLAALPAALKTAILGDQQQEDFQKAVADFTQRGKLYSSYAFQPQMMSVFAAALCSAQGSNSDITICFLNQKPVIDFKEPLKGNLFAYNFRNLQIYSEVRGEQTIEKLSFKDKAKGNRTLRIIFKPLPPNDADALLKASEKETHFSGDSSLFKALALGKYPSYYVRPLKHALAGDLIELARRNLPALGILLHKSFYGDNIPSEKKFIASLVLQDVANLFHALREFPEYRRAWNATIADIHKNQDFAKRLPELFPIKG